MTESRDQRGQVTRSTMVSGSFPNAPQKHRVCPWAHNPGGRPDFYARLERLRRGRVVNLEVLPDRQDAGQQPLVPHLINLGLEVVDIVGREVGEAALSDQEVSYRLT